MEIPEVLWKSSDPEVDGSDGAPKAGDVRTPYEPAIAPVAGVEGREELDYAVGYEHRR